MQGSVPLTCFTGVCGGRDEKRNTTDILTHCFFKLPFSVESAEKWPGKRLFDLVACVCHYQLCSYGCGAAGV